MQMTSEQAGLKLEELDLHHLGTAKQIKVTRDDTIIMDGGGDAKAIQERCSQIQEAMEAVTSGYEKEKLEERLAKLSGGVAVVKVGGASEVEVNEKKVVISDEKLIL